LGAGELSAREVRLLIAQGLRRLEGGRSIPNRRLPVYVTVREYDTNLSAALIGFGFAPFAERARFVKHTAAVVRAAEPLQAIARQAAVARQGAPEMTRHE
jgi:hypothetical protein